MRIDDLLHIGLHEVALTGKHMVDLLCEGTGIEQAEVNLKFLEGLATNGDPANYFIRFVGAAHVAKSAPYVEPMEEAFVAPGNLHVYRNPPEQRAPIVPKLGHNIGQREEDSAPTTPQAIYAYPLTQKMFYEIFVTKNQDFATDEKFLLLFSGHGKFLLLDSSYTKIDFANDIAVLEKKYSKIGKYIAKAKKAWPNLPAAWIWNVTRQLSQNVTGSHIVQWMRILWKDLGYGYAYDPGNSIIHPMQPHQAAFFSPNSYKLVQAMENPLVQKSLHQKRKVKFDNLKP